MTGKITLREPTSDDLEFIQWLWADPETMAPVGGIVDLDDGQAKAWFISVISPGSPGNVYRLIVYQNRILVGEISCHQMDPATMMAELNIKIAAKYRGKGYGKQALTLFVNYFFNVLGGQALRDKIAKGNLGGKMFLLTFGFKIIRAGDDFDLLELSKTDYQNLDQVGF